MKSFHLDEHPVAFLRPRLSFPFAWAGHIPFAYLIIDLLRPRQLVELGTDSGNSYLAFCQAVTYLESPTQCTAVDSWQGDAHARKYADDVYLGLKAYHDPLYRHFSHLKRCFFDDAVMDFQDGSVDLLHIDGLHSYEAVKHDFETWLPKLSDRAVVLFHDTQVRERGFGVYQFLEEVAASYPTFDFSHSNGLGVVQVGSNAPEAFRAFMRAAMAEPERMRHCFSQLGQTIVRADGSAPAQIDVVAPDLVCSLFYRKSDEHFSEERLLSAKLDASPGKRAVSFVFPEGVRPAYVRLDPGEAPGVFRISAVRVSIDGAEGADLDVRDLHGRLGFVHCDVCPMDEEGGLRIVSLERDPYVEIDVSDCVSQLLPNGGLALKFELTIEAVLNDPIAWATALTQARALDGIRQAAAGQISMQAMGRELHRVEEGHGQQLKELGVSLDSQYAEMSGQVQALHNRMDVLCHDLAKSMAGTESFQVRLEAAMQSSSKRSVWTRLRRRLMRTEFSLMPVQHLESVDPVSRRWRITGNDPIFTCGSANFPLPPGWYLVRLDMQQFDGRLARMRLYPDYGPGMPQDPHGEGLPPLKPGANQHVALVRFLHPVHGMRFDPATSPCELSIRHLVIRRIGRLRAGMHLLRTRFADAGAAGQQRLSMRRMLGGIRRLGLRGAADHMYRRYSTEAAQEESYAAWVENYDATGPQDLERARAQMIGWAFKPMISVLVPTYNSDETWLRQCIESVRAQAYPHWELCIADDASPDARVMRVLNEYANLDKRIHVVRRAENGHISATTNSALALASGEYVALLDHDDELHPLALFEVVRALQSHPEWQLIYTDEDKIDLSGRRYDPYMKPDWNYDLLLSQNCISHLGVYQRQLVLDVGGFREGLEGSQDWDLALRCIERLQAGDIGHVPRVLYHWRAVPGSTAVAVNEKSYARHAGLKAISEHLERVGANAAAHEVAGRPGNFRVSYALPDALPKVSLIIPTRDGLHLLKQCVDSILESTTYANYEIVIVDNQSSDPETLRYFRDVINDSRVSVIKYDHPFNYSALNNHVARQVDGEVIGLINNDIEVITPEWLSEMVAQALRPEIGAVGAMLYYPNDTIQHAGVVLGVHGVAAHAYCGMPREYPGQMGRARLCQGMSAVTAACLLVRREIFEEVGGLDESLTVAFNDIDFCLRVCVAGYRNVWTPFAELYHHESATRGHENSPEKLARFEGEVAFMRTRWPNELEHDPAYSPNLTLVGTPFDLAFPPREIH